MSYGDWNEKLVEHVFGRSRDESPVSRIPATPEELCVVAGRRPNAMTQHEIDAVVADFLGCVKSELATPKRGLLRYCLYYREDPSWWSPNSYQQPYFFAMLWLTCLVAYGFPEIEGDFYARMRAALGGKVNLHGSELGELDEVWEDLETWAGKHPEYRSMALPPRCPHRTIIGRSHFLAFPHRIDRAKLATILQDEGLTGHEPPVRLVLEALEAAKKRFSDEFQDDLKVLFSDYLDQGRDPKDSPFWRAVRQAARELPSLTGTENKSAGEAGLLAERDADDLLTPFVAFSQDWVPPPEWIAAALELNVGKLSRRAVLDTAQIAAVLAHPANVLRAPETRAIEEGFVPLIEEASGLYRVAVAEEIASCEKAFVREDRADAVRKAFGGRAEESGVRGWVLVTNARFEQRDELDPELSSIRTLLQTTDAPRPAMVGGVRAHGTTFYALEHYLPLVRARHASRVLLRGEDGEGEYSCAALLNDTDHWRLPEEVLVQSRTSRFESKFNVIASYEVDILSRRVTREARTRFELQNPVLATEYKGLPSGSFRLETCARDGETVNHPGASLPLGLTTDASERALDILPFDPSARWLGPGLGEMCIEARPRFPWLVVGPKNRPEYLVLQVEDANTGPLPNEGFSPFDGDRRHWKKALSKNTSTWWRRGGVYTPEKNWPAPVKELVNKYRARATEKRPGSVPVPEAHLDSRLSEAPWGVVAGSSNRSVPDVLAALFQNRAFLSLREVGEHISRVLDLGDALQLRTQLVRALTESGAVDSLRSSNGRQTIVVARRPRLMAYRRGPRWMAVLIGLTPSPVRNEFRAEVTRLGGATLDEQRSSNEHLPGMMRVNVAERKQLLELSTTLGFVQPEYVDWPDSDRLPGAFQVAGDLRHDPVPDMYTVDAVWCWSTGSFRRNPESAGNVSVERRRDGHRVPIYVVCRGGVVLGWSYYRTWALLSAHEACDRAFLREEEAGVFAVVGNSPLHLPLPIARLCAVVGLGAPGPRVSAADPSTVEAYCYPFGSHLSRLLLPFLPSSWISRRKY